MLLLSACTGATTQLPSLDAKCTGTSKYVHSSAYSARVSTWGQVKGRLHALSQATFFADPKLHARCPYELG